MANIDDAESAIITAQNVELQVGASVGNNSAATADKLVKMREVEIEKDHPETRIDHGKKRTYTHATPDISIRFIVSGGKAIFAYLQTRNTVNTQNVLPIYPWNIKCTADDGTVKNLKIAGKLPYKKIIKNDADPQDPVDIECRIRVTDDDIIIS